VFVKKNYLSSWVFTTLQSVHIRMNSSLNPPLKKSWIRLCYVYVLTPLQRWSMC